MNSTPTVTWRDRRDELEQIDRKLKAAGSPGLRMLEDFEVDELIERYKPYVRHDRDAIMLPIVGRLRDPSPVPGPLADREEFVKLSNHRQALRDAHKRFTDSRRAWELRTEAAANEHRAALVRAGTHGGPTPERPYVEPWEYEGAQHAIENRFRRILDAIEAAERGLLAENAETYVAWLDRQIRKPLARRAELVQQVQRIDQEIRPIRDALEQLDPSQSDEETPFLGPKVTRVKEEPTIEVAKLKAPEQKPKKGPRLSDFNIGGSKRLAGRR